MCAVGLAGLLSACAPTLSLSTVGRVVNSATGEEGSVTFAPGALRARAGDALGSPNVTLQVGSRRYSGRVALVDVAAAPARPNLSFSVGVGFSTGVPAGGSASVGLGTPRESERSGTRTGNIIARTGGDASLTLTCTLAVDPGEHGVGDCAASDGARYVLQF